MSMEVLDRPPTDIEAPDETEATECPTPEPDAESGGYALKFARRRRTKSPAAMVAERKAARLDALAKKQRHRLIWMTLKLLVPGLILVGVLSVLGSGSGERVTLPKALEPAAFAGLLDFSATERVGTLFQATLRSAAPPGARGT